MQGKGIADPGENNRSECTALAKKGTADLNAQENADLMHHSMQPP